jgi:hypothetical protein
MGFWARFPFFLNSVLQCWQNCGLIIDESHILFFSLFLVRNCERNSVSLFTGIHWGFSQRQKPLSSVGSITSFKSSGLTLLENWPIVFSFIKLIYSWSICDRHLYRGRLFLKKSSKSLVLLKRVYIWPVGLKVSFHFLNPLISFLIYNLTFSEHFFIIEI